MPPKSMTSPVFTGTVWVTFFPLSRVPFLVCRGWSFQLPLSSRSRAAWLRETVGKSRLTSAHRPRPMAFSQWHRSRRVPSPRVSHPQISFPGFSRNRDIRQRTMITMATMTATTRRIPQATGRITSMAAPSAAPVSAFSTAARTWSPSWEKITPKRAMSSCMRPSFLRQTAPVCPLDTVHGRRQLLRPRTRIAFSPAIGPHYIIIWGKHKSKPVSALAPQAPTVLHW